MTVFVELLTSPNCVHSPKAVRMATSLINGLESVHFQEISMITEQGKEAAREYGVERTPAFAINGKIAFVGVPSKKALKEMISDAAYEERSKSTYFF